MLLRNFRPALRPVLMRLRHGRFQSQSVLTHRQRLMRANHNHHIVSPIHGSSRNLTYK